jgi:hypothetical protein
MNKFTVVFLSFTVLILSCTTIVKQIPAYYVSPLNGEVPLYKPGLVRADSLTAANFLSGGISFGGANDAFTDKFYCFNAGISRSRIFNRIGLRYGASLIAGSYRVNKLDSFDHHSSVDPLYINKRAGRYFFGSFGADGGVHYSTLLPTAEFHIIGAEFSINNEFGSYLKFRNGLPANVATHVNSDAVFGTFGLYSELISRKPNTRSGLKLGLGRSFIKDFYGYDYKGNRLKIHYNYFTMTTFFTKNKWGGSIQLSLGDIGSSLQFGTHYRL